MLDGWWIDVGGGGAYRIEALLEIIDCGLVADFAVLSIERALVEHRWQIIV